VEAQGRGSDPDLAGLARARALLAEIGRRLPRRIVPADYPPPSHLPFRAAALQAVLVHRLHEIGGVALDLFDQGHLVPAFILTRALGETAALLHWLEARVAAALVDDDLVALAGFLEKAMLGSRDGATRSISYSVLTAIAKVERDFPAMRSLYDNLCEYSHPNWSGALGAYGRMDEAHHTLELGHWSGHPPPDAGLLPLLHSLEISLAACQGLDAALPTLVRRCQAPP